MASESAIGNRFQEWSTSAREWLQEQLWYQQAKAKWDELDPQSRTYLSFAAFGGAVLLVLFMILSAILSVRSLKNDVSEKQELLNTIQAANEELRSLRERSAGAGSGAGGAATETWPAYLENQAAAAGIAKPSLAVSDGKPGNKGEQVNETLFDVTVKGVALRQLVRYTYSLENGPRPMKVRTLTVESVPGGGDPAAAGASLNATLSLSGFAITNPGK